MLAKLVFVLVIFSADGSATPFARFNTVDECQRYADSFNAGHVSGNRAMCMPENVKAEIDIDQAVSQMITMLDKMKQALDHETVSNQRPTP